MLMAMNNGERLHQALNNYFSLQQHQANADFRETLRALQQWQIERLFMSHHSLLQQTAAQHAAEFLFYQVYGGANLTPVANDIQRATNKAMTLLPQAVMHAAAVTLEAAVLTQQLDEALAQALQGHAVTADTYTNAYRQHSTPEQRQQQLTLIEEAATLIDRYVRRRLLIGSFKIMRRPAYAAKLNHLYDFLDEGFIALGGLASVTPLIKQLTYVESQISERVFNAHPNPFDGVTP